MVKSWIDSQTLKVDFIVNFALYLDSCFLLAVAKCTMNNQASKEEKTEFASILVTCNTHKL